MSSCSSTCELTEDCWAFPTLTPNWVFNHGSIKKNNNKEQKKWKEIEDRPSIVKKCHIFKYVTDNNNSLGFVISGFFFIFTLFTKF